MKLFLAGLFFLGIPTFYLIRILRKERIKKQKQLDLSLAFDRLVKQVKISDEHSELLNGKVIALDKRNKKLLVIDHNQTERQEECIPLLGVESCKIVEVKDNPGTHVKKIFLELKHKWNNKITHFCFYDDSYDLINELPELSRRAKFWKRRIDLHKYPGRVGYGLEYVL